MKMDIAACADNRFVMPTGVMFYSVCKNNPDIDIVFHVIVSPDITNDNMRRLEETVTSFKGKSVQFYRFTNNIVGSFPAIGLFRKDITQVTYYRLWMAEILPNTVEKVLYLDGDIIVRHSLLSLWDIDITNYALAVVPDMDEINIGTSDNRYLRLGIPQQNGYFNAGVLLVNLSYWRKENCLKQFFEFMENKRDCIRCHDQDVLNVVFNKRKLILPIKYNFQSGFLFAVPKYDYNKYQAEVEEARKDPIIVHYTEEKPWWTYNRHQHPFKSLFFKYRDQTIWNNEPLWEIRPLFVRIRKTIAVLLRRWKLIPELAPNGCEYIDISPID